MKLPATLLFFFFLLSTISAHAQSENNSSSETSENSIVIDILNDPSIQWHPGPDFMPEGIQLAFLQGNPEDKNIDVLFKMPANSKAPNHWHNSQERMVLISGELTVQYEGEEPSTLKPGYYAYGPSKKPHTAECGDAGPCILYIAFVAPLDAFPMEVKN
ncbi:cupin [Robertkochia solimangrovi]|nr:cupin [Robertkochia solimangrovi]